MAAERDPRACVQGAFTQLRSFELQVLKLLPTSGLISALEPGADFMWDLDDSLPGQKMPWRRTGSSMKVLKSGAHWTDTAQVLDPAQNPPVTSGDGLA